MGFVRQNLQLEEWLDARAYRWSLLSDLEYRQIVEAWRCLFENRLVEGRVNAYGATAMDRLVARLPDDVVLLRGVEAPNMSQSPPPKHPFAYQVEALDLPDWLFFNELDLILVGRNCSYACVFTHEWMAWSEMVFLDAEP